MCLITQPYYSLQLGNNSEERMQEGIVRALNQGQGAANILPAVSHIVNQHRFLPIRTEVNMHLLERSCSNPDSRT